MGEHLEEFSTVRQEYSEYKIEGGILLRVMIPIKCIHNDDTIASGRIVFADPSSMTTTLPGFGGEELKEHGRGDVTESTPLSFEPVREPLNIYETKTSVILVGLRMNRVYGTGLKDGRGDPVVAYENDILVNLVKRPAFQSS